MSTKAGAIHSRNWKKPLAASILATGRMVVALNVLVSEVTCVAESSQIPLRLGVMQTWMGGLHRLRRGGNDDDE